MIFPCSLQEEVEEIMESAKNEALSIVRENTEKLDFIASGLLEKGTMTREEIGCSEWNKTLNI